MTPPAPNPALAVWKVVTDDGPVYPGDRYRHYKGTEYVVRDVSLEESTLAPLVTYRRADGDRPNWTRSMAQFYEKFEIEPGRLIRRFTLIEGGSPR